MVGIKLRRSIMGLFNGRVGMGLYGFGGVLIALCATGCGGGDDKPSGSSPDFSALQKQYASPSGTLHASDKAAIIAALDSSSATKGASPLSAPPQFGSSDGPGPHVLGTGPTCSTSSQNSICIACPGGGTLTTNIGSGSAKGASGTEVYNQCNYGTTADSLLLNGKVDFVEIIDPPPVTLIYSGSIDESIASPPETLHVDLNYAFIGDMIAYNVKVSDGNVLIEGSANWDTTTQTGSFTVVTKDGTTSCTLTNGAGSCTGTGGTVTFS
jgi:hypothetical protein